uniref:Putative membrane protein n=1 Tax=Vibrio sp. FF_291 TaxID=1652832 RepID=A0A0H3ZN59_9VIBR|nr:putative membrane protein [Vibrio sp. FF_291]
MALGLILIVVYFLVFTNKGRSTIRLRRHKRYLKAAKRTHKGLRNKRPAHMFYSLRNLNPYVFEELILVAFSSVGCKVKRSPRYSGDGGIDGKVKINGQWYFIQAKKYEGYINPSHVSEFAKICDLHKKNGFFIHTGKTGKESYNRVGGRVKIISGNNMLRMFSITSEPRSWFDRGGLQRDKIEILLSLKKERTP